MSGVGRLIIRDSILKHSLHVSLLRRLSSSVLTSRELSDVANTSGFSRLIKPIKQKFRLPSAKQLIGTAILSPVVICGGYFVFAYYFRESLCYDYLQRVDTEIVRSDHLVIIDDIASLRNNLSSPPNGVTLVCGSNAVAASNWINTAIFARPACVSVNIKPVTGSDEFIYSFAEGLGLEYYKIQHTLSHLFVGHTENIPAALSHLRCALGTVTNALERIRGEGNEKQLHPVIVIRGLHHLLDGLNQRNELFSVFLSWCAEVTSDLHLAHVVFPVHSEMLLKKTVDDMTSLMSRGNVDVWACNNVLMETIQPYINRKLLELFPNHDAIGLKDASELLMNVLNSGTVSDLEIIFSAASNILDNSKESISLQMTPLKAIQKGIQIAFGRVWSRVGFVLEQIISNPNFSEFDVQKELAAVFKLMAMLEEDKSSVSLSTVLEDIFDGNPNSTTLRDLFHSEIIRLIPPVSFDSSGPFQIPYVRIAASSSLISEAYFTLIRSNCQNLKDSDKIGEHEWVSIHNALQSSYEKAKTLRSLYSEQQILFEKVEKFNQLKKNSIENSIKRIARPAQGDLNRKKVLSAEEELQLEFEQLVLQHAHIRRAIEIAEVEQNSICQGNENFKRVLYSIRHVISSALSACSKASHLHSNSAIKDIATGVLEHIAEKNDGLLAADTIQGVLCSLGRPMRLSDVNRSMHLLSELPIDGQVDVSQLVEKMFAMMPEAGDGFEPHAHSATEYFDNSKNTNVETYADKIATNQVEENIKEEE